MADTVSSRRRSEIMSSVKSTGTGIELIVRRFLLSNGFRIKLHNTTLPGKPDIAIFDLKCAVFVNGCFWHGHKRCRIYVMPKTNKSFWYSKVENNIRRDLKNQSKLRRMGWGALTIWECQLKPNKRDKALDQLLGKIHRKGIHNV